MSQYEQMTKAQLLDEVQGLRERVGILEGLASEREQVEEALRESEEEYRILVENSPDLVLLQAPDGEVLHCSSRSTEILGYSPEEVRTLDVFESIDKADVERVREAYTEALRGEELVDVQYRFIDPTGKPVWLSHTARPVRVGGGLKAIQSNIRDITELRRAEEALRESEKRFRELAELLPVVVFETDEDNRLTYMNRKAYEVFAYSPDDFDAGLDGFCMIVESEREHARDRFARRLRGEPLDIHEYTGLRNDGGTFPTLLDIVPILRGDRVVGSRGIIVDITEHNRAQEALARSERLLAETGKMGKVGGWNLNIDDGKLTWTEETCRIHEVDLSYEPTLGQGIGFYSPASRPIIERAVQRAIEQGEPYDVELEIITAKGNLRAVHAIGRADLEHRRVYGFFQDITERKQAETLLRESNERHRDLLDTLQVAVVEHSAETSILYCNRRAQSLLGLEEDEATGRIAADPRWIFHREDGTKMPVEEFPVVQVLNTLEPLESYVVGVEQPDSQEMRWVLVDAYPRFDEEKALETVLVAFFDITERKRMEVALRESEAKHAAMVANISDVIGIIGVDGIMKYKSPNIEKLFGWQPEELVGTDGWETVHPDDLARIQGEFALLLAGDGSPRTVEYRYKCKDGSYKPIELTAVDRTRDPAIGGVLMNYQDITERNRAEEKLRQSDERLRKAQRTAKIGNWEYDIPTGKVWGSEEAFRIYGIERTSEFLPLDEVEDHILEAERVNQALVDLITRNAPYDLEFEIRPGNRDGVTQIHSIAELDCDPSGDPVRVRGVIQDITERKQAEAALRESEERFRTMFEKHDGIMLLIEPDSGAILDANAAAQKFYGYSLETFRRMAIQDINTLPPEEVAELRKSAEEEERNCFEFPHRLSNGDVRTVEVHSSPLITSGQIILFSIIHDITERKRAEEELTKYRSFLEKAQELGHIGTWELDLQKDELFWTEESYRIFGVPQGTPATYETFLERVHPDDRELIDREWKAAVGGAPYKVEHRILVDGEVKWVTQEAELTLDQDGTPIRGIGFIQDITERRQAEEAHSKLEAQLTQAQKLESVGRLAGGVAHDFNNMLSVILGYTDMALSGMDPSDPLYHAFTEIEQAGSRSADLTRQLLTFARKQVVAPKVLDLNEVSQSMLTMLRRLIGEDIDLVWMPGRDTWPVSVDPAQVDQMLANLCVNARDAISGVGKVTIETENVTLDEDSVAAQSELRSGDFVMLAVSDDGCGMDADTKEHIFEPFYTTKAVGEGTGLGLATVYGIAKQNGGFVTVYSEVGEGTTFKIYLPRHVGDAAEATQSEPTAMPRGQGETVLLVEDEAAVLKVGSAMLSRLGYTVLTAGSPGEALTLMTSHSGEIDLLIADVVMPEMNGRELAEQLQSQSPGLRCLFVSGYTADVILHRGVLNEGVQFLQKPFTASRLAVAVKEALRGG